MTQTTATSVLRTAGFAVSAVPVNYGGPKDYHRVVLESPPAGSLLQRGSLVTIFISIGVT
jgi:beta-lactam-binding protein with PASTA domain